MNIEHAIELARTAMIFGQVQRATLHPDRTPESDTTHTVMLAMVVAELAEEHGLDASLAVSFAVVHDLPETHAGDTNTARGLTADQAKAKEQREAASLARLTRELGAESWAIRMVRLYEQQEIPEARLVRYADKALPKLTHVLNSGKALAAIGMTADEVVAKHKAQGDALHAAYPEFPGVRSLFLAACREAEVAMLERPSGANTLAATTILPWVEVDSEDVCMFALVHYGCHLVVWGTHADVNAADSWTVGVATHAGGPEWTRGDYESLPEACKAAVALAEAIGEAPVDGPSAVAAAPCPKWLTFEEASEALLSGGLAAVVGAEDARAALLSLDDEDRAMLRDLIEWLHAAGVHDEGRLARLEGKLGL